MKVADGHIRDKPVIMVVDDDPSIGYLVSSILEKEGYETVQVRSGIECLKKIDEVKPDLIFMDIMMPELDGWEVCKIIKEDESTSSIPVSMLSIRKDLEDLKKSFEYAHADAHIAKPLNRTELINAADYLLRSKADGRSPTIAQAVK